MDYGLMLARLRGRRDDATVALRRAEVISGDHPHRDALARATFGELLVWVRQDVVGRELRGWPTGSGCIPAMSTSEVMVHDL